MIWRRLPRIFLWGSLVPVVLSLGNRVLAALDPMSVIDEKALLHWDFVMAGVLLLHWMVVLSVGLCCFIVRVMKGPAYVADAYPLPEEDPASSDLE